MKTYLLDLIPQLQRYSQQLDDLTKLTNQHWVVVDELSGSKNVYIFRSNNELLIAKDGRVEKARWEYLGNNSLLIDKKDESYLFKHGFLDDNVLALKVDSKEEYALLVNENKFDGELNSVDKIGHFLRRNYLVPQLGKVLQSTSTFHIDSDKQEEDGYKSTYLRTNKGKLEIRTMNRRSGYEVGDFAFLNGQPAPDGRYSDGWPSWFFFVDVKDGRISGI